MTECNGCGKVNDLTTDDLYNIKHTHWECEYCGTWNEE